MIRTKYIYNKQTCTYEPYKVSPKTLWFNLGGIFAALILLSSGLLYFYQSNFTSVKETSLRQKNEELLTQLSFEKNKLNHQAEILNELQKKDDNVYRTLLGLENIPSTVRKAGIGGTNRFEELESSDLKNKGTLISHYSAIDQLKGKIYIQTKSFDEIENALKVKREMWSSRPAITPMAIEDINKIGSGFRWRVHPIHKVSRFHYGLDIQADRGSPIYASGDGVVTEAHYSKSYGNVIYINHGYGYETRYGHMTEFKVKEGDRVKRGDVIGTVGSTGWSTAPHLHYEVILNEQHVDPVPYLSKNLNPEEYERLIQDSNNSDLVLDY